MILEFLCNAALEMAKDYCNNYSDEDDYDEYDDYENESLFADCGNDSLFDYEPSKEERIEYGYNVKGEYVPVKIGNKKVEYGYNAKGEFVPVKLGNDKIDYNYNVKGKFVPTSIGKEKIEYN